MIYDSSPIYYTRLGYKSNRELFAPLPCLAGSRHAEALDIEPQVIVASLQGTAVWAKTAAGISAPYRINAARPFWLSRDKACPGDALHLFGFGVRKGAGGTAGEGRKAPPGCPPLRSQRRRPG
ncbi:MAG: hypothetical protein IT210_16920 [Armatimonadetes bacterium]|nr:hypothetical protein [Armatimonadota bacterium]